jgi:MFS family permease
VTTTDASPPRQRLVTRGFVVVMGSTFAYFTALGMLVPTLPAFVEDELGGHGFQVGIVSGLFAVSAALVRPFAGRLGDRRGRRILVVGGAGIMGLSVLCYTLVSSLPVLIALRLVSGIGEAAMFVGAATAIQDLAPPDRRAEAASYYSVALYAGIAIGPSLGEALANGPGYDTLWLATGASALLASALGLLMPATPGHEAAPGGRLLHPAALGPGFVLMLGLIPFVGFSTFLKVYGEEIGLDEVGAIFAAYAICVLVIRLAGARLPDKLGWRLSSTIALTGAVCGSAVLAVWASSAAPWLAVIPFAIGSSLLFPALFATVVDRVPESERGQAVGTFSIFFDLANGLGAPFLGLFVSLVSYQFAFGVGAVIALFGFVAMRWAVSSPPDHIEMHIAELG